MIYALLGLGAGIALGAWFRWCRPCTANWWPWPLWLPGCGLGGFRSSLERHFDLKILLSGFFANGIFAVFLCYFGYRLGMDLYYVP